MSDRAIESDGVITIIGVNEYEQSIIEVIEPGPQGPRGADGSGGGAGGYIPSANIVSSSQQINSLIPNIVSGSAQINSGSFSGSFYGSGANLTGVVSASYALTASYVSGSSTSSVSSSYALTASYAFGYVLNSQTSSMSVLSASYAPNSSLPSGILSSSAQIASDISGSFVNMSGSLANRVFSLEQTTGSLNTATGSILSRLASIQSVTGSYVTTGSNTFIGTEIISGSLNITGSINVVGAVSGTFIGSGVGLTGIISASYASTSSFSPNTQTIGIRIKTEDSYITEGSKGYKHIGYNSSIVKLRGIANIAGNININVKREGMLIGNYQLSNQSSSLDTTLTNWTSSLSTNDLLEFYVSQSSTYITDITFFMDIQSI